jgi:hypothetical protein
MHNFEDEVHSPTRETLDKQYVVNVQRVVNKSANKLCGYSLVYIGLLRQLSGKFARGYHVACAQTFARCLCTCLAKRRDLSMLCTLQWS